MWGRGFLLSIEVARVEGSTDIHPESFAGARHSASDREDMQTLHDIAVRQGAACKVMKYAATGERYEATYLVENFVSVQPGEPYRLFPFGRIVKAGRERVITPEYARSFKLPHFKPPIKLGSHDETTPAGGHLLRLEVRETGDPQTAGLWAVPELTDKGNRAMADGDYRYHSPEVIWDDGGIEDPTTGEFIRGPLIVGDALLHAPHLGERTAFYHVEPIGGKATMAENDMITMPANFLDRLVSWFRTEPKPAPAPEPQPAPAASVATPPPAPVQMSIDVTQTDEFKAMVKQAEEYKAKLDAMVVEQKRKETLGALVVQLQDKGKFGMHFVELKAAEEAAGMLDMMPPECREWCMRNFSALIAQIKESNLTTPMGTTPAVNASNDPAAALNVAIEAHMKAQKVDYVEAYNYVKQNQPDLFNAYLTGGKEK